MCGVQLFKHCLVLTCPPFFLFIQTFIACHQSWNTPPVGTFSIQEQHAYVRLVETESKSALTIDACDKQQTDGLERAESPEEG